ncbi:unnamed protein product [Ilex paraguariensis]
MLCEVECCYPVVIPAKSLDRSGLVPQSTIVTCLLKQLLNCKAAEECGYFLAVTNLKSIDNGKFNDSDKYLLFLVTFCCRTFLPVNGEVMLGVVQSIHRRGVFLKCGPMKYVYLSARKMPNYYYVDGKNPYFISDDLSRIENDVVIRFMVFGVRWTTKNQQVEREFMILATLEGDRLGPISLPGSDELGL